MSTELVHIGFDNIIAMNRVVAMLSPSQQPTKRIIRGARDRDMLIDATHARKAKAAIIVDTGHIILAAISPEAISRRLAIGRGEVSLKASVDEEEK